MTRLEINGSSAPSIGLHSSSSLAPIGPGMLRCSRRTPVLGRHRVRLRVRPSCSVTVPTPSIGVHNFVLCALKTGVSRSQRRRGALRAAAVRPDDSQSASPTSAALQVAQRPDRAKGSALRCLERHLYASQRRHHCARDLRAGRIERAGVNVASGGDLQLDARVRRAAADGSGRRS